MHKGSENLKSYQKGGRLPSKEQREKANLTRRLKRTPITECLRAFFTGQLSLTTGEPYTPVLSQFNANTLAMVRAMVGQATGRNEVNEATMRSTQMEILARLEGLHFRPPPEYDDEIEVAESVTLIDRRHDVPLPIADAEVPTASPVPPGHYLAQHNGNGNGSNGNGHTNGNGHEEGPAPG